jgi:hypothetical protein
MRSVVPTTEFVAVTIDWASMDARRGRAVDPDARALLELSVLEGYSRELLTHAEQIRWWGQTERDTIATAHAAGMTVAEYLADQQGDDDW